LTAAASVRPAAGELVTLMAPGQGFVKDGIKDQGTVIEAGDVLFSFTPQADPVRYVAPVYNPYPSSTDLDPYQEREQKIRDNYQRQMTEANGIITSCQEQVNRAFREQAFSPKHGYSYELQLAQNALARAREVPAELNRKMALEYAEVRAQRESDNRLRLPAPASPYQGAAQITAANGDMAVTVADRACVWSLAIRFGTRIVAGQACAELLPEGGAVEVQAVIPVAFAKEIRPGLAATLEVVNQFHDAEMIPLRFEKLGNRELDREEVASLIPTAPKDGHYRLVSFAPVEADPRLFPPPKKCRLHLRGAKRCLLQRILS
jgi:hypothetical protein